VGWGVGQREGATGEEGRRAEARMARLRREAWGMVADRWLRLTLEKEAPGRTLLVPRTVRLPGYYNI